MLAALRWPVRYEWLEIDSGGPGNTVVGGSFLNRTGYRFLLLIQSKCLPRSNFGLPEMHVLNCASINAAVNDVMAIMRGMYAVPTPERPMIIVPEFPLYFATDMEARNIRVRVRKELVKNNEKFVSELA